MDYHASLKTTRSLFLTWNERTSTVPGAVPAFTIQPGAYRPRNAFSAWFPGPYRAAKRDA